MDKEDIDKLHGIVGNLHVIQGSAEALHESLGAAINNLDNIKKLLKDIISRAEQSK